MRKTLTLLLTLAALATLTVGCDRLLQMTASTPTAPASSAALNQGKPLAKIGEITLHEGYLDVLARINPRVSSRLSNATMKKRLVDSLIEKELLYQGSLTKGLENSPEVQDKLALYTRIILGQALLENNLTAKAKEYYNAHTKDEFERVGVAHMLFATEPKKEKKSKDDEKAEPAPTPEALEAKALEKIKEVQAKLKAGEDFEKLAEQYSDDTLTAKRGGSLGQLSRGEKRLEHKKWTALTDAAFRMKKGEVSEPIKTPSGYHILKLVEESSVAPFETVEKTIRFKIQEDVKNQLVESLKAGGTIEYLDAGLKSAAAAPAAKENEEGPVIDLQKGSGGQTPKVLGAPMPTPAPKAEAPGAETAKAPPQPAEVTKKP